VVDGLHSPHMGGMSKWNVLADDDISRVMPEVFAAPPVVVAGFMAQEAEAALFEWNELVWVVMKRRGSDSIDRRAGTCDATAYR
jgi:tRNA(adenine34) deaminase